MAVDSDVCVFAVIPLERIEEKKCVCLRIIVFVSFHSVSNLSQPGTFAGNDAIVAFARSQQVKVVIHQLNTPLWEVGIGKDFQMIFVILCVIIM